MESFKTAVSLTTIRTAHENIKPYIYVTPVIVNPRFNDQYGRNFFFKCENMQKTGSFKIRGAVNAVLRFKATQSGAPGVVTRSSGNHGLAVALAARIFDIPCTIVTPRTLTSTKRKGITAEGARLIYFEPSSPSSFKYAKEVPNKLGYHFIPSADDYDVINGQATLCIEFLQQVPDLDAILVSASGGGLAAGVCIAAKEVRPQLKVFIVEPVGKDLEKSLRAGERSWPEPPLYLDTVADGLRQQPIGLRNWPIILEYAEKDVFSMSDDEIIEGTRFAFQELKVVVEPSAGICVAAAMSSQMKGLDPSIRNIGVVLCGGNVDLTDVLSMIKNPHGNDVQV